MNEWFYIWDTRSAFGWAALSGTAAGARRLDFGFATREECLAGARLFKEESSEQRLRAGGTVSHHGPQKGPTWLFPAVVAITSAFLGSQAPLSDIPRDWSGHTKFQKAIWRAALKIPYGQTRSYAWIADKAGHPGAARAAGSALGANPLPLIVPCHRIINSNGKPGGFGMGTDMKKMLLDNEKHFSQTV